MDLNLLNLIAQYAEKQGQPQKAAPAPQAAPQPEPSPYQQAGQAVQQAADPPKLAQFMAGFNR